MVTMISMLPRNLYPVHACIILVIILNADVPKAERLPPEILRVTTAGRMARSALLLLNQHPSLREM